MAFLVVVPMVYLLGRARRHGRRAIYIIWIGTVIAFQLVELLLDYVLVLDFRDNNAIVIPYVMLFFAEMGALIGIASRAGRRWVAITGPLFLVVAVLTFVSRDVTGV